MLDGIDCSVCGLSFKDDDMVLLVKSQFKLGATSPSIFFKQTPVSLAHLNCTDQDIIDQQNEGRITINDIFKFFGQKHVYEYMTKTNMFKEDNKRIMKDLGIECQR